MSAAQASPLARRPRGLNNNFDQTLAGRFLAATLPDSSLTESIGMERAF